MYSPKRRFRLFRDPAFTGGGGGDITYTYTWSEQTTAATANYYAMVADGDFSTIAYTRQTDIDGQEGAYISTNDGATWTRKASGITWSTGIYTVDIAVARDVSSILYLANRGTPGIDTIRRSTNGGDSWSSVGSSKLWTSVACSANGSNVLATELTTSNVWVSYDSGSNWTQKSSSPGSGSWLFSFVSDDGTFMIATLQTSSNIWVSSNSGSNWSAVQFAPTSRTVYWPVCSSNGQIIAVNSLSNTPRISRDYGVTWTSATDVSVGFAPYGIAMSRSGKVMAYAGSNLPLFVSQDEGVTWQRQADAGSRAWYGLTMNGTGSKILAGVVNGKPWLGTGV